MKKKLKTGYYFLLPTWDFKYAQNMKEALDSNPLKIWKISNIKDYDEALEEAGFIRMAVEGTDEASINIV